MANVKVPQQVASRKDTADVVVRFYKACQKPAVLEAGGDAARAVVGAVKRVEKFVSVFRGAWVNG